MGREACTRLGGSSPLARGLPDAPRAEAVEARIIPARAGFTPGRASACRRSQDHPRSRGVYLSSGLVVRLRAGSSPLARGLLGDDGRHVRRRRIIPARAGFTVEESLALSALSDHPRSRGVYQHPLPPASSHPGSSPLARGLRRLDRDGHYKERIIPARAGFTRAAVSGSWGRSDHPRSRGVYRSATALTARKAGSSPLARGLQTQTESRVRVRGIIPARAGFTEVRSWLDTEPLGSSPLARGLRGHGLSWRLWRGIIPARAGFTSGECLRLAPSPDHPRSRGVYDAGNAKSLAPGGSSPLARGLPDQVR